MHFSKLPSVLLLLQALHVVNAASPDDKEKVVEPCTVASTSGSFYDLRPLTIALPEEGKKPGKNAKIDDWRARGWDYQDGKANFTLNICAPVVGKVEDVEGIDKSLWKNVSAHYTLGSKTYSIGQQASELKLRGRRLVLQYTGGSPCSATKKRSKEGNEDEEQHKGEFSQAEKDDHKSSRQKSTIISFHCDKDPLATQASATFVGTDPDECSYHFEVLSTAACIGSEPAKQGVGPAAVFAIIGVIAILVYFLGGVFYQRNVAHARGWRQLPNYSMWAGIGNFIMGDFGQGWYFAYHGSENFWRPKVSESIYVEVISGIFPYCMILHGFILLQNNWIWTEKDIFIIATSSCARFLPSRRGYSTLSVSANGSGNENGRGRNGRAEDENRLIDQLDEEWDD